MNERRDAVDKFAEKLAVFGRIVDQFEQTGEFPVRKVNKCMYVTKLYDDGIRGLYRSECKGADDETLYHEHHGLTEVIVVEKGFLRVTFVKNGVEVQQIINKGEGVCINPNVEHHVFMANGTVVTVFTYPPLKEFSDAEWNA